MTDLAHVKGDTSHPLIESPIGRYFDDTCARYPDVDALISAHQNIRLTYAELQGQVNALAVSLRRLGLRKGDRLGIWALNTAEWAITQFATAKLGVILVNINPAYRTWELKYAINKVGCRALIISPSYKTSDYVAMLNELAVELVHSTSGGLEAHNLPSLRWIIRLGTEKTPGMLNFDDLLTPPSKGELETLQSLGDTLDANDPINIQFTSGTTGAPKGATLTHRNILNNGFFVGEAIKLRPGDRLAIPVPLYHCFGMVMGNLGCLTHAATIVYSSASFDPGAVLQTVATEDCVGIYGVPTMFIALLDHPDLTKYQFARLRTGIMAGSPCPVEVMKKVIDILGMSEVTIAYGMTETSPVSFQSGTSDSIERRVSTVGRVQPHCEVKIISENGETLARGLPGELCTRGYSVMKGYWDDAEKTAEAVDPEGWMHTGDVATIDDEGFGNIVGRIKDMVIRGGENIYPREVEEFLYSHPKVRDVQVVGIPDPKLGEELFAWIIAQGGEAPTEAEIIDYCRGQIAHYKIPRYVRFVESFPMTVTGKIQKYLIRDAMKQELGIEEAKTA
ncbi:AMP-binding protein [Rhizobium sp. TH2]|uniref:AMP-binding protein n=1 Tax=Rhizobium sp. TH2 TaxID=2775403 RepID=UPI0021571E97|nr:AMP-binding protein [Rhizobium sp. TH2]UVC06655.1 AMP-binding protein [Rhizobium sp. TH2]